MNTLRKSKFRILHLEDNLHDREIINDMLEMEGIQCQIVHAENQQQFMSAIASGTIDLIVSDHSLPEFDGTRALEIARKNSPHTPFIFVTGSLGEESAVEKMKCGATDYVLKHRLERLVPAILRALEEAAERSRREQAEEQLRRSDELFRQISENVHDLIAILDLSGNRLYNSTSYRSLLGDPDTLRGTNSFGNIHPDDVERIREIFQETVETGIGQRTEYRLVTRRGDVRFVESQGSVIRDKEGKIINVLVVSRDITERRKAEQHLREQAALLGKAHDAIYVRDIQWRITYWNPSAERIYGWTAAEAIGQRTDQLIDWGLPDNQEVCQQVMDKGEWRGELKQQTKSGRMVVVEARRNLLYDGAGRPHCVLNINTDITEKKLIQEQLLRTQRMESIGALAGGIAHDLNNVLAPILMAAELLQDEVASENGRRMLETMKSSAQRGSEMVKQVLSFARGTGSETSLLQARHLVAEMAKLARETFPRSISIATQISNKLHAITGNPTQIHQVLLNLCVNARDAMPNGGSLILSAQNSTLNGRVFREVEEPVSGLFIRLGVADTGTGIPSHLIGKLFEPFFTTKGVGKGTGIGLSTVKSIIKSHGGYVEVESEMGKGATFNVYLPVTAKTEEQPSAAKSAETPGGNGELILVVDDERALLEITREMLESFNYRTVTAANGADALSIYHQHRHDIKAVVIDMVMPVMDGRGLIRALKETDPKIRLVLVSGFGANAKFTEELQSQVNAFLTKPYTTEEMLTALQQALAS